jgi:hypothetical protein
LPRKAPSDFLAGPPEDRPLSSEIVFHSPQLSQRPDHLEKEAPQAEHENVVLAMADQLQMFPFCSSGFDEHSTALMGSFHLFPSIWGKWPEGFEEQRITYN